MLYVYNLCRLLGEERSIVSDVAGTTRDAVDALLHRGNATYRFVDTAGVRKRGKVEYGPEFFMVNRSVPCLMNAAFVVCGAWCARFCYGTYTCLSTVRVAVSCGV
jgi:predicted GTPase